ncbi:MAG: PQQ-dependent sugar dehydrogenase [Ferruginibacter sp.]
MLGLAFHPQYDGVTNRYFFIYHNTTGGDIAITRCQTMAGNHNVADMSTITNIITIPHPTNSNHNGGQLRFGPDGYLYFATGDGGGGNDGPNNAQTGTVLLGKMIRIDIDNTVGAQNYAIPADNPYIGNASFDERVWALGLRNPYRFSFDRLTGDMWIGDVGQNAREEINYRPAGSTGHVNYGWRCYEGYISTPGVTDCTPPDLVWPVFDYLNPDSGRSVTGGFVYRGIEYPTLYGRYVATDVYTGYIWILSPNGSGGFDSTQQAPIAGVSFVVGFGEAEDGTLYAVSQGTNTLYKVTASGGGVLPVTLRGFSGVAENGYNDLKWQTASELNTARFNIEYGSDGTSFTKAGTMTATRNTAGSNYNFRHYTDNRYDIFYRLAIEDDNGSVSHSNVVRIPGKGKNNIRLYPTAVANDVFNLELVDGISINTVKLINTTGSIVFKQDIRQTGNKITITLPSTLAKGIYMVQLEGKGISQTEKIIIQ